VEGRNSSAAAAAYASAVVEAGGTPAAPAPAWGVGAPVRTAGSLVLIGRPSAEDEALYDAIMKTLAGSIAVSMRAHNSRPPFFARNKPLSSSRLPTWLLTLVHGDICIKALLSKPCACGRSHKCLLCETARPDKMNDDDDRGNHGPLDTKDHTSTSSGYSWKYACPVAKALARGGTDLMHNYIILRRAVSRVNGCTAEQTQAWFLESATFDDVVPTAFRRNLTQHW